MFGFQRLDAYRAATELLAATSTLSVTIPRGHVEGAALENPRRLLERIVSMLTGLLRP